MSDGRHGGLGMVGSGMKSDGGAMAGYDLLSLDLQT